MGYGGTQSPVQMVSTWQGIQLPPEKEKAEERIAFAPITQQGERAR